MGIGSSETNFTSINRKNYGIKLLTYWITLFLFLIYLLKLNKTNFVMNNEITIFILSWFGILTFLYVIYTWFKVTAQFFTPYIIFMLFFFLFNYGQPIMWALGIHIPDEIGVVPIYPGHGVATNLDIINTQIYTLMCAWMLHLGALLAVSGKGTIEIPVINKNRSDKTLNIIFKVSLAFALVSIPITLWASIEDLKITMKYGYRALYFSEHARRGASIANFFSLWFFPSLIGLLIGSKFGKKTRIVVSIIMLFFILLNVAAGDRHPWVYKIFILLWLSHVIYKPIAKKKIFTYLLIAVVSLYFLDAIVSLRNTGISASKIIESLSISNSSLIKVVFEMGSSMNTTLYIQNYGEKFWQYGNTYLLALGGLITNGFLEYFDIQYGILSRHFGEYLGIDWGPGFSIVAEPLINFGQIFAPLFMIILGFFLSKVFYVSKDMLSLNKPLRLLFVASSLDVLTRLNRDSIHLPLKNWFYGVVIFCFVIYILKNLLIKISKPN